jgi:hypothetical protein
MHMTTVHVEFHRVQTWLFSVPRLRAMVGANVLLGETLRVSLPALARQRESGWTCAAVSGAFPPHDPDDPIDDDDPRLDASAGVLARDGGHFEAHFTEGADAFGRAATQLVLDSLPGLPFTVTVDDALIPRDAPMLSPDLPVLAPCAWSGRGLASFRVHQGDEHQDVSLDVARRHDAARRVVDGSALDVASLLTRATQTLGEKPRPESFEALTDGEYLAVIYADGNGVGGALSADAAPSERATFFYRNRVLLRRAVKDAIDLHCGATGTAPLVVLMLGGDDLLVACRASLALPFIVDVCKALERLQGTVGGFRLTLGIGAVIGRPTLPFHRLHAVAEALASSAKRTYRGLAPDARTSVVDWSTYTTAWADDPAEIRARDWVRGTQVTPRVLSRRPVAVLGSVGDHATLEGLLAGAAALEGAPRSQLRFLVDQLSLGRSLADLAYAEASRETRASLESAGLSTIWTTTGDGAPSVTSLLDLVEVYEIGRLGRQTGLPPIAASSGEVAHE